MVLPEAITHLINDSRGYSVDFSMDILTKHEAKVGVLMCHLNT
jgi:hypothetical protein